MSTPDRWQCSRCSSARRGHSHRHLPRQCRSIRTGIRLDSDAGVLIDGVGVALTAGYVTELVAAGAFATKLRDVAILDDNIVMPRVDPDSGMPAVAFVLCHTAVRE